MDLSREQKQYVLHLIHHEKTVFASEEICAALLGYDLPDFREIKMEFAHCVRQIAQELLSDPTFCHLIERLPFKAGSIVVGLGDSITDDYTSWCEILREVLALHRPDDGIQVINAGVSGQTTTEILSRFLQVVNQNPDWLIIMAGTNDARRHGLHPTKSLVSSEETEKNYEALRAFSENQTHARICWMTPPPVIPEQIVNHWFLSQAQVMWLNEDLQKLSKILLKMPDLVVDLQTAFDPPDPKLFMDDGLHPSLEGQKVILRALVEKLANIESA